MEKRVSDPRWNYAVIAASFVSGGISPVLYVAWTGDIVGIDLNAVSVLVVFFFVFGLLGAWIGATVGLGTRMCLNGAGLSGSSWWFALASAILSSCVGALFALRYLAENMPTTFGD